MTQQGKEFPIHDDILSNEVATTGDATFPPQGVTLSPEFVRRINKQLVQDKSEYTLGRSVASVWEKIQSIEGNKGHVAQHSHEVAWTAQLLGKHYGLDEQKVEELGLAALLHDVGQIVMPWLVNKRDEFTAEEKYLANQHPLFGAHFLTGMQFPSYVAEVAQQHHTAFTQLHSEGVTRVYVELITIADAYAAVRDPWRVWQPTYTNLEARDAILQLMRPGERFNPIYKDALRSLCDTVSKREEKKRNIHLQELFHKS